MRLLLSGVYLGYVLSSWVGGFLYLPSNHRMNVVLA